MPTFRNAQPSRRSTHTAWLHEASHDTLIGVPPSRWLPARPVPDSPTGQPSETPNRERQAGTTGTCDTAGPVRSTSQPTRLVFRLVGGQFTPEAPIDSGAMVMRDTVVVLNDGSDSSHRLQHGTPAANTIVTPRVHTADGTRLPSHDHTSRTRSASVVSSAIIRPPATHCQDPTASNPTRYPRTRRPVWRGRTSE
jgi:hypothetical protein